MKVLSFDVGLKNLAYCLFDLQKGNNNNPNILKWDVINIANLEKTNICEGFTKQLPCQAKATLKKNEKYYCLKHAKKQCFVLPTNELKMSFLKKQPIASLKELAQKYDIVGSEEIVTLNKKKIIELFQHYTEQNCFEPCQTVVPVSRIDLVQVGRNIKIMFEEIFQQENGDGKSKSEQIDYVIIENQIGPLANRMNCVQSIIAQYFIMKNVDQKIEMISSANKLKDSSDSEEKKEKKYCERKKKGIEICLSQLKEQLPHWSLFFQTHKKKDDLADSFLQGMWFIKNKLK